VVLYTRETRGNISDKCSADQERGGSENRARSRAAVLLTSVAPGALLQRYVAVTSTSVYGRSLVAIVDFHGPQMPGKLSLCFSSLREVPVSSGRLLPTLGGNPAMINLRTAFWRRRHYLSHPPTHFSSHHPFWVNSGPYTMSIELIDLMSNLEQESSYLQAGW
jgi:hypothetical protein